jgi:hypothetical protein
MFERLFGRLQARPHFTHIKPVVELYEQLKMPSAIGCAASDIRQLETTIGQRFPASYFEFLAWMGNGAGQFLEGSECLFMHVSELQQDALDLLRNNNFPHRLPDDAIVVWMHQGYQFLFINSKEGDDPPVHWYHEALHRTDFELNKYPSFGEFLARELVGHAYLEQEIAGTENGIRNFTKQPVSVHVRDQDAESNILNELWKKLRNTPLEKGTIKLTTDARMCISCRYLLKQFRDNFPNIRVDIETVE